MPKKPLKLCKYAGCSKVTEEKYFDKHKILHISDRANACRRGYNSRWRRTS